MMAGVCRSGSGGVQPVIKGEGDGGAVVAGLVDADAAAQLFRRVLYLAEALRNSTIEIGAGVPNPDHRTIAFDDRLDMDAFLLGAMNDPVEQIPQDIGQHMLVDAQFQFAVDVVDEDTPADDGQREEGCRQFIDETMQANPGFGAVKGIHILDFRYKDSVIPRNNDG